MTVGSPSDRTVRPLMAAARAVASDATMVIPRPGDTGGATMLLPRLAVDPVDELTERIRPAVAHAVDALQVAARLEADGITDRLARSAYGYTDVFALAEEVFRRLDPGAPPVDPPRERPAWQVAGREVSHGVLYLLPAAAFPAVLNAVGTRSLVAGLVLAGALGWIWAGGASWLAYRRLGAGDPAAAGRVLRVAAAAGIPAAALLGTAVVAGGALTPGADGGLGLVALATGQMTYQMASTLLMFYKREGLLLVAMLPAVAGGAAYLLVGPSVRTAALAVTAASVLAAFAVGVRETLRVRDTAAERAAAARAEAAKPGAERLGGDGPSRARTRGRLAAVLPSPAERPGFGWAVLYAALSAAYLLHAQHRYVLGHLDVALAAGPLIAAMGVVEWRARRFAEQGRALLRRVRYPAEFAVRMWLRLLSNVALCSGAVVVFAVPLLLALHSAGHLSAPGVVMAAAHAVLAGAYYLGFLLAGQGRDTALCAGLGIALVAHAAVGALLRPAGGALADTSVFLGSAVLLQVLFVLGLAPVVGQVRRYR